MQTTVSRSDWNDFLVKLSLSAFWWHLTGFSRQDIWQLVITEGWYHLCLLCSLHPGLEISESANEKIVFCPSILKQKWSLILKFSYRWCVKLKSDEIADRKDIRGCGGVVGDIRQIVSEHFLLFITLFYITMAWLPVTTTQPHRDLLTQN